MKTYKKIYTLASRHTTQLLFSCYSWRTSKASSRGFQHAPRRPSRPRSCATSSRHTSSSATVTVSRLTTRASCRPPSRTPTATVCILYHKIMSTWYTYVTLNGYWCCIPSLYEVLWDVPYEVIFVVCYGIAGCRDSSCFTFKKSYHNVFLNILSVKTVNWKKQCN